MFFNGHMEKSPSPKPSTTVRSDRRKMDCLTKEYLDLQKIGNVTVENIKELDTEASSATNAVLK